MATKGNAPAENGLDKRIANAAFAFRGYNVTNLGKTPELLEHRAYGPIVAEFLQQASNICSDCIGTKVNLVSRVRKRQETTLRTYAQAIALIVSAELAQIRLLEEFFDISYSNAKLACGYSLGEPSSLVAGGVFDMESVLIPLVVLAKDAADLAKTVTMGVLFSRGPALDCEAIHRLCLQITNEGRGAIAIASFLSPNTVLLLGQRRTIEQFKRTMHDVLPASAHLRRNPHRWPPMHTTLIRQANIPDRASVILETLPGGFVEPQVPILSCVTGDICYDAYNSRQILRRWVDHPQRLWDVIDKLLRMGVETIIHVGPEPNIMPATLTRLSIDVSTQLNRKSLASLGLRAMSRIVRRRPWLTSLMSSDATLLRAPFVEQITLENWLLEQQVA